MTRIRTPLASLGAVTLLAAALAGCTPAPEPTPTPTAAFASEEEAFAAAEETYRAYNDAVNAERAGDSDASPESFLTGEALESDRSTAEDLRLQGLTIQGDGLVSGFDGVSADLASTPVTAQANVCLDVGNTRVIDEAGTDVTPPGRPSRLLLTVSFVNSSDGLLISESNLSAGSSC